MKIRHWFAGAVLVICTAAITTHVVSQDMGQEMSPQEQEMYKKWMEYATPGPFHKHLEKKAGNWNHSVKFWTTPDAPPGESTGTSEFKMIMGGRYLVDKSEGVGFDGSSFQGMGLTGYDNLKKKFVGCWIDSMGTGLMTFTGTCDAAGKVFTFFAEGSDPMTGTTKTYKTIEKFVDETTWTMEMFDKGPDGKEFKSFEITYKKAG